MLRRALILAAVLAFPAAPARAVTDGATRYEVITPSLIRIETAPDGRFEDRRTLTTGGRLRTSPRFRTWLRNGTRTIRTSRLTLRRSPGGRLRVRIGRQVLKPVAGPNPAPLGGWRRSLDHVDGPVPLHEGVLSRAGWYLLDDSRTALLTADGFAARATPQGYRDLYLFAYGRDYRRALRDLRTLTGASPLLPRKAFGVWFSRWWPYGAADWQAIRGRFSEERVPLDTISVDTDFKRVHDPGGAQIASAVVGAPGGDYSWNGWDWNRELYPDPPGFLRWADAAGLEVGLNIHPSISTSDPRYPDVAPLAEDPGCRVVQADPFGTCMVFDWTDRRQLGDYMALHEPFERDGVDFWWLDWCCDGSRADAPGLTPDTWINKQYFDRQRARGSRWPAFQRMGGSYQAGFGAAVGTGAFAEHRYTLQFTGDTCATWPFLAFASEFTAAAAAVGQPYVSHDIGTFFSESPQGICDTTSPYLAPTQNSLSDEMYVRWVQLGALQPFDRLHSHHNRRLPWEYAEPARSIAAGFLRLRGALVPYLYTLARQAHDRGQPMARALYLTWPGREEAYEHRSQYTLGRDLLVAPVAAPGDPAEVEVWFPPGVWVDWFTGERHRGPATRTLSVPLERMPLFVRRGGIVPLQPYAETTPDGPLERVVLRVEPGRGAFTLYDDAGDGLDPAFSRTRIVQRRGRLRIGAARGDAPARRSWVVRVRDGERVRTLRTGRRSTRRPITLRLSPPRRSRPRR